MNHFLIVSKDKYKNLPLIVFKKIKGFRNLKMYESH